MTLLLQELRDTIADHYRVDAEIGRGGMATVYVAEDLKHGRRVALKVLSPELSSSIDGDRFRREIQIAARLSHPNILPVFDSGEANGLLYYTMPFVDGESLRKRLDRESQLPIDDAVALFSEVADALSYAHSYGVVHRDIKPENILLHAGHAVVADFGIARIFSDAGAEKLTQTGMSVGTAAYMSPEQFAGEQVDGRSDQYSLACVLYEMLVGQVPFTGPNAMAIMARHTMEQVPSIRIVRQTVPDELENAILQALEKTPADRFATMQHFKDAVLGRAATASHVRHTRSYTAHTPAARESWLRSRRGTLVVASAAVLLAASVATAVRWQRARAPSTVNAADPELRRIAVLYFDDDTKNHSLADVADGLTHSLITQLMNVDGLDVVSAAGVAAFRSGEASVDSIGRALHAGMLVRGSIEDDGDRLHVSVRLVDGQTGADFQRASFRVARGAFLNARDSLASAVADLLRARLGEEIRLRDLRTSTRSADAWVLLQRAEKARGDADRAFAASDPLSGTRLLLQADSLATRATALDPAWPAPVVMRASVAYRQARAAKDAAVASAFITDGLAQSTRALALDPRDADALEMRGTLQYYRLQRGLVPDEREAAKVIDIAERDLRDAVTIAPRQASAWNVLSVLQYGRNNPVEANLDARRAYEADAYLRAAPDVVYRLWATSYDLEQFVDAAHWCAEGGRRFDADPRFVQCRLYMMLTKAVAPEPADAWRLLGELEKRTPRQSWDFERRHASMLVAIVLGRAGLRDSAERVLERAHASADVDPQGELIGYEALARTFLGEQDQAVALLERYFTNHPDHRAGFAKVNSWWWRDLKQNPRFRTHVANGR